MNRNIVTPADVVQTEGLELDHGTSGPTPTTDDFWARLAKYVPIEMISAYLIVQGLIETAYTRESSARSFALAVLLVLAAVGTWFFSKRVLRVKRWSQIAISVAGLVVWVFAIGGWFATTDWWLAWMGTAGVVAFGVLVKIAQLPPLPSGDVSGN